MKREILLAISASALVLAGCATHEYQGGTTADTGSVYGYDDSSTSDFGRGEAWRNTPEAQRDRGRMQGPVEPEWDMHAPGYYVH